MQKVYNIYFSPTGSSKKVGERIADTLSEAVETIDLCKQNIEKVEIDKENLCVISVPCYGGRVPKTAAERLQRIHAQGAFAIVCVTFGNRAFEDALVELADICEKNGFQIIAGAAAVTEHNIMHVYGTGRPEEMDERDIVAFTKMIEMKMNQKDYSKPKLQGNHPYKEYAVKTTKVLLDKETCTNCGTCAKQCPVGAISLEGEETNTQQCINCMRCIQICPTKSRKLPEEFVNGLIEKLRPVCEERKMNEFFI